MRPLLPATEFFTRMFTSNALALAEPFLHHEAGILKRILSESPAIKTVVVIGSGPLAYRELVRHYRGDLVYVGVDPYYQISGELAPKTFILNQRFENLRRHSWGSGPCLYVLWFNVLFYLHDPIDQLNSLLSPGDVVVNSGWSPKLAAQKVMEEYFSHVYYDSPQLIQPIIQQINQKKRSLKNQLPLCPAFKRFGNGVNFVEVLSS